MSLWMKSESVTIPISSPEPSLPLSSNLVPRAFVTLVQQSRTQSPNALWPAVGREKKLWGTGILLPQDFCGKTKQAVTEQPMKKSNFFRILQSLLATKRWQKSLRTLGTSRYEIAYPAERVTHP